MQPLLSCLLLSSSSLFLFSFPFPSLVWFSSLSGKKNPAFSASFTQMAANFVSFLQSARYVYLCSCEGYPVQPRSQGAFPWLHSLHTKTRWTMKSKSINAGGRFKRNRPWFFAGEGVKPRGYWKVLYGEAPLQGPSLLPTIFEVTEVAGITSFVAWKKPMIELLEDGLPEHPEPLSLLISWVNPFPSRLK